ncbi:MAG: porin, partial [Pseudomonadota bacterium]
APAKFSAARAPDELYSLSAGVTLYGSYSALRARDALPGVASRGSHYWLGADYQLSPRVTLRTAAYRYRQGGPAPDAALYVAGAEYFLSKRTMIYATYGQLRNSAGGVFTIDSIGGRTPLPGHEQSALQIGLSHAF